MKPSEIDLAAVLADERVVWTEDVLRFRDTDANGHVNNSAFAVFCESGRVHTLHEVLAGARPASSYFVVARLAIQFRAELHYPGRVRCGTWLPSVGRSSLAFAQVLLDGDGRLVASSEATVVQVNRTTRRSEPFDDAMRSRIDPRLRP